MKLILLLIIIFVINNSFFYRKKSIEKFINKKKIVIIGNGPSILKKNLGNKIDDFDIVVRFNSYKTKNFEKNVGTKTDIWFINAKNIKTENKEILDKIYINNSKFKKIYLEQNTWDTKNKLMNIYNKKYGSLMKIDDKFLDSINCEFIPLDFQIKTHNKHFIKNRFNPHASLGLLGLNFICEKYPMDKYKYYILGFDNFKNSKIHYMDNKDNKTDDTEHAHNQNLEEKYMKFMINKYNIQLLH